MERFCTDDGDHTVRKCTLDGKVLFTLGMSGKPALFMSGEPFNGAPTWPSTPATGIFMSPTVIAMPACISMRPMANCSSCESGTDPGEFNIVHNIATDSAGWSTSPTGRITASRCLTQRQV